MAMDIKSYPMIKCDSMCALKPTPCILRFQMFTTGQVMHQVFARSEHMQDSHDTPAPTDCHPQSPLISLIGL